MLFRFTYTSGFGCVKIAVLSATGMLCCLLIILLFNTPPAYYHQVTRCTSRCGQLYIHYTRAPRQRKVWNGRQLTLADNNATSRA